MTTKKLKARFMAEPRFAKVDGSKTAVLLDPYLDGFYYEEDMGSFDDDVYDEFIGIIRAQNVVLLAHVDRDGAYRPVGLYSVKAPSFSGTFACNLGGCVTKVTET